MEGADPARSRTLYSSGRTSVDAFADTPWQDAQPRPVRAAEGVDDLRRVLAALVLGGRAAVERVGPSPRGGWSATLRQAGECTGTLHADGSLEVRGGSGETPDAGNGGLGRGAAAAPARVPVGARVRATPSASPGLCLGRHGCGRVGVVRDDDDTFIPYRVVCGDAESWYRDGDIELVAEGGGARAGVAVAAPRSQPAPDLTAWYRCGVWTFARCVVGRDPVVVGWTHGAVGTPGFAAAVLDSSSNGWLDHAAGQRAWTLYSGGTSVASTSVPARPWEGTAARVRNVTSAAELRRVLEHLVAGNVAVVDVAADPGTRGGAGGGSVRVVLRVNDQSTATFRGDGSLEVSGNRGAEGGQRDESTRAPPAAPPAAAASSGRIPVGARVRATATATAGLCLGGASSGSVGVLLMDDGSSMPYRVLCGGITSWYHDGDIALVDDGGGGTEAAPRAPVDLSAWFRCGPWTFAQGVVGRDPVAIAWTHGAIGRPGFRAAVLDSASNGWLDYACGNSKGAVETRTLYSSGLARVSANLPARPWEGDAARVHAVTTTAELRRVLAAIVAGNVAVVDADAGGGRGAAGGLRVVLSVAGDCTAAFLGDGSLEVRGSGDVAPRVEPAGCS